MTNNPYREDSNMLSNYQRLSKTVQNPPHYVKRTNRLEYAPPQREQNQCRRGFRKSKFNVIS